MRGESLDPQEIAQLQEKFPGKEFEYRSSHPRDYRDHAETCRQLKPDLVILPKDRPIPSVAMEEGFVHVAFTPKGVQQLLPLRPEFKPFEPQS